ncbi:MAG TPA: single-stranded DNA-binding protein [Candidatus Limnocylindria bacterium]|nr:single-stranded DNA-binding protein [Candidatus Limnocylindria bacterium]
MSVNKVILVGNLGKDPDVRYTQTGSAVANFSIATSEQWNDRDGKRQERTEWHNIVVWGKQAEHCGQYLSKGRQVFIEGSIRTRSYDDKSGNKRYVTEIIAQRIQFLGGGGGSRGPQPGMDTGGVDDIAMGGMGGGQPPSDDDIPF